MARERENLPVEVRPYRVGLTLSGGGAKGFAHVGALKAMEELSAKPVEQKGGNLPAYVATDEMCTFLVVNISSLQLIPVNIIAYRSQYGSANPAAIVGPAIIATTISTLVGVIWCKIKCKGRIRNN